MSAEPPRVVVFGYSEVGYQCLELLIARGASIVGVFTHADDPGENHWFRSVAGLAKEHGIPVFTPETLKAPEWSVRFREEIRPDLVFSFYYRHLIPMPILESARLGAVNMHGSYLPAYRGKAPVNWAVLHGADHTGATLHHMVARPDAGDVVDQEKVPIGPDDTAEVVMNRVTEAAVNVLDRQLAALLEGTAPRTPQDESQATYFGGRTPEDGRISWELPARDVYNLVRAVARPYPGAFADFPDGRRLRVWWARMVDQSGAPGEILSESPLVIAAADRALEVTEFDWEESGS